MITIRQTERRLAVIANWGVAGPFGLGLIQSGAGGGGIPLGLLGVGLIVAGFLAQLIINRIYGRGFSRGEIALGFAAFGVAALGFIFAWLFDPAFDTADKVIGLAGLSALMVCFLVYVIARYGLKGSFSMFHQMGRH